MLGQNKVSKTIHIYFGQKTIYNNTMDQLKHLQQVQVRISMAKISLALIDPSQTVF